MASGRVVHASRHRHRARSDRGRKVRNVLPVQLLNLTLALAAGERGDERCGSGPARRIERLSVDSRVSRGRVFASFTLFMNNE